MIETSCQGDVTRVLMTPRYIGAPMLRPTHLIVATPLGGSKMKDITHSYNGLLVRYVGNIFPHIEGLLVLLLGDLSNVCKWIRGNITTPYFLYVEWS